MGRESIDESYIEFLNNTLRCIERDIVGSDVETAIVVDVKGNVVFSKIGSEGLILFTEEETSKMADAILTHNHPNGKGLSVEDIMIARGKNLAEIRAVGVDMGGKVHTHRLIRSLSGWEPLGDEMQNFMLGLELLAVAEYIHWDEVLADVAYKLGAEYICEEGELPMNDKPFSGALVGVN